MKYMETGGFQTKPLMRLTIALTLVLLTGLWVTNAAMYFSRMGLTPSSVARYYNGSEEEFQSPRSAQSMLETTHQHLPIFAIVILLLTHLMIFAPYSDQVKRAVIVATFAAAFLGEGSGWLVRFVHPAFAWLKIACFAAFQMAMALLLAGLAAFLWQASRAKGRAKIL